MRPPSWRLLRLTRSPLAVEITLALLLKVVILALIWKAFFAAPQTKKMVLPTPQVEQHMLAPAPTPPITTMSNPSLEAAHDSRR